jgi:hypothetical protein
MWSNLCIRISQSIGLKTMRISVSVNGNSRLVASLPGPGYLDAHLNMSDRPKESKRSQTLRVIGIETQQTETVHLQWPTFALQTGDVVELRLLPEGQGDLPTTTRTSTQHPANLLSNSDLAKELVQLVSEYDKRFLELLDKSKENEPADEHNKFVHAVGAVICEIGDRLLFPVYRRHKELIPDNFKGELL